ncbi:restriction endonuclease subunit S [Vagococcus lutrae]|uniref:restriction endonuclease subunit S n=1 Tax=Vagococcus lutrae TaxID=81947 RepID=UPI0028904197|nr:restriction endonuclease subunit S [Vagococcus lutrae]MDT2823312.1 restriction endonuclease subunit S [Vagococcus lutrae]
MKQKATKPVIRFAGFTDDWEPCKIGEVLNEFNKKSTVEDEYPMLSSTNNGMEVRQGRVSGTSNLGYKVVSDDDLVLSPQNLWLGNININDIGKGLVSPSYKTFKLTNIETNFLRPQLRLPEMLYQYMICSTQGASVVRRNLELELFYQIILLIPVIREQQKIGNFFKQLDDTIALHQRQLEALEKTKKSFLQKMFPKKDETKPEIRFSGFTDDWEQRKLGEIIQVNSGKDYKHLNEGEIPVYGTGGYMLSVDEALSYKDAIGLGRKGTINKPYLLKAPFWTVDTLFYSVPINNNDLSFIDTLFQNINWKKYDESTGVPSLSKNSIVKIEKKVPSIEEQEKIGLFFKKISETIALHQRQLEALEMTKKSFLQKMFI